MKIKKAILLTLILIIPLLIVHLTLQASPPAAKSLTAKELYQKHCASCHGADGKGVEKIAKMLKTTIKDVTKITLTPELSKEWMKTIKDGKGKMLAYKTKLKEAEIDSVFNYMKAMTMPLAKGESSAKKDTSAVSKDTTKKK